MIKKDYILRIIEEVAKFIAILLGLKKAEKYEEALEMVGMAIDEYFHLDPEYIRSLSSNDVAQKLMDEKNLNIKLFEPLADLLHIEADIFMAMNQKENAKNGYQKAFHLLKFSEQTDRTFSAERLAKISELEQKLKAVSKSQA